jgi:DNA-binding NarL/FixJ family response regulator
VVRPELNYREMQVLLGLADGASLVDIAEEMGLSMSTVSLASASVRTKLGARNMTHMVALAYHTGLLVPHKAKVRA